mmetsp:Transcript_83941/g.271234  ORF Transcript_83941/g.271234 Transcript_83941/m.271234 type:complete len:214 (+) Transcript_83941:53-694(+)
MARSAPAVERNRGPIWDVLSKALPAEEEGATLRLLEISSGTGQHAAHFAAARRDLLVQPSDRALDDSKSVAAHAADAGPEVAARVRPLARLDVLQGMEAELEACGQFDVAVNINMLHFSLPECGEALFAVCAKALRPGGFLFTYGPYRVDGFLCESNQKFEAGFLKGQDERFAIRELRDLEALAAKHGFSLEATVEMPANNLSLIWRRDAPSS